MQARSVHRAHHPYHQIHRRQVMLRRSEPVPDDPLDPIPRAGPGDRLLADNEAQSSVVHSIENQVQT